MRESIHDTRRKSADKDRELLSTHLEISNRMRTEDWNTLERISLNKIQSRVVGTVERQKKFERCGFRRSTTQPVDTLRTVVNLSNRRLTAEETVACQRWQV